LTEDDYEPDPIDLQDAARGHMTPGDGSDADYSGDPGGRRMSDAVTPSRWVLTFEAASQEQAQEIVSQYVPAGEVVPGVQAVGNSFEVMGMYTWLAGLQIGLGEHGLMSALSKRRG
jgi:hypothetical protein